MERYALVGSWQLVEVLGDEEGEDASGRFFECGDVEWRASALRS